MSDLLPPVVAKILADSTQFKAAMLEAGAQVEAFGKTSKSAFDQLASVGKVALAATTTAAVGIGVASVKMAGDFESAMLRIQTQAGGSAQEVRNMTQAVLDLAPTVGEGPQALAESLFFVESAGLRGAQALDVLKLAAEGARVGNANLEDVTNALTAVMVSHVGGVRNATEAMGALNAIVGQGKMTFQDLSSSMSSGILDTAATFGVSLQSMGAALDIMTDHGVPAEQAATRLRMTISLMGAPTAKAAEILQTLGLNSEDAAAQVNDTWQALEGLGVSTTRLSEDLRKPNGFYVALSDLRDQMQKAGLDAEQQAAVITRAFGGARIGSGILSLYQNLDVLQGKFDAIGKSASDFPSAWALTQKTFNQQLAELGASAQKAGIELGTWLIPKVREAADWMSSHIQVVKDLAEVIGVVLVAAMSAYIVKQTIAFGAGAVNMVRSLVTTVMQLGAAVGGLSLGGEGAGLGTALASLGIGFGTVGAAAGVAAAGVYLWNRSVSDNKKAVDASIASHQAWALQFVQTARETGNQTVATQTYNAEVSKLKTEIEAINLAYSHDYDEVKRLGIGTSDLTNKKHDLEGQLKALEAAWKSNTTAMDAYQAVLQGTMGKTLDAKEAAANLTIQTEQLQQAIDNQSTSTDSNALKQAELSAQLASVVRAAQQDVDAMVHLGTVHDDSTSKADALNGVLRDLATRFPSLSDEIETYITTLGEIPRYVETTVETQFVNTHQDVYGTGSYGPGFAEGGIVERPTMALVGEAGKELILPLTNMRRTFDLLNQAGLVQPFAGPTPVGGDGGAGGGDVYVVVNVSGSVTTERDLVDAVRRGLVAKNYTVGNLRLSPR